MLNGNVVISFCALLTFCSLVSAGEIVLPAAQIEQGKGSFSIYWANSLKELSLKVSNNDEIIVDGNSYFSQVDNDLETKTKSTTVTAQWIVNPWSGFYYWLRLGTENYEIEVPSSSVTNHLESRSIGWRAGAGMRKLLFPDTFISPAVAFETALMYEQSPLNSFKSGTAAPVAISNTAELTEFQMAVLVSKKLKKVEPYGGVKIFRDYLYLKDNVDARQISGVKDNIGVFAGARLYLYPHEALIIEGSVLGENSITAAWNVAF
jgi:hypothetical protein